MAITVAEKGTANNKGATYVWLPISGLSAGDTIIAVYASDVGVSHLVEAYKDDYFTLVATLTRDVQVINSGNIQVGVFSLVNITSQQASDIAFLRGIASAGNDANAIAAYTATGLDSSSPLDKSATATGSGTTAGAGPTDALSQADELAVGAIGMEEQQDEKGTWTTGSGYIDDTTYEQQDGTSGGAGARNISVFVLAEIVSAMTALSVEQTATGGNDWAAAIATYKAPEAAPPPAVGFGTVI